MIGDVVDVLGHCLTALVKWLKVTKGPEVKEDASVSG